MGSSHRVYLEEGEKWVFACSIEWPGWCRRGKGDSAALETLVDYASRYREIVGSRFSGTDVEVIGRLEGNATTDFGAPASVGPWDDEELTASEARRQTALLEAAWRAFDGGVEQSSAGLRKGPRGGGRDRDQIVDHVREAERTYARKIGVRIPPRTPWKDQRQAIVTGIQDPATNTAWPVRYFLRRTAWHVLDHLWEIEDRQT
jgi:hypothetical protein